MMLKLRPFELGLVVTFGVLMIAALVLLNTYESPSCEEDGTCLDLKGGVSIWGTLSDDVFSSMMIDLREDNESFRTVSYRYIPPEDFDKVLVDALADQTPPDLLFMSHERLVKHRSRLQPISYDSFPERDFRNLYIDGASIFALQDGVYAFPVMVDPLVMYWNRDILSDNGFLTPPKNWEELVSSMAPLITIRDFNRRIQLSTLAMGEYVNVKNAFPILSTLLLQAGSPMVSESKNNEYMVKLNESNSVKIPLTKTLDFYTSFSNVNNSLYSWNRTLGLDQDVFLREDLAFYFGYGSEARGLEEKNPNLSFDIAEVPQGENSTNKRVYGNFYGFFIPKSANNKQGAYQVMSEIGSQNRAKVLADGYNMAPVHRSSLSLGSNDVYGRIIYLSAYNTRAWLNPDLEQTDDILSRALEDISANRQDTTRTANDVVGRLQAVY
ncbi:MAG: extracellular solute-binding protein [Candidatus Paceibacterota bacterium]